MVNMIMVSIAIKIPFFSHKKYENRLKKGYMEMSKRKKCPGLLYEPLLDFISLLTQLVVYSLPTAMSSVTQNHTINLFYLLKENFKYLLFDSLIREGSSRISFILSSCSLSQRWRFKRIRSNVLRGIESDLVHSKVLRWSPNIILLSESLWHPLISSMFKN